MTCLISNASLQPPVYDVYTALLIWVIPNQHFKSTLLGGGGGGHKKEYAVYARENDDNYGRPLSLFAFLYGDRLLSLFTFLYGEPLA